MDGMSVSQVVMALVAFAVVLAAVGLGTERVTEIAKVVLRWVSKKIKWLAWVSPQGLGSWFLAAAFAYAVVAGFKVDFLSQFEVFSDLDPSLVKVLNQLFLWVTSNLIHQVPQIKTLKDPK